MKSGFKDPIAVKNQHPKDHPKNGKSFGWDFTCPQYDERTSSSLNAGTHYGVGHRQPVGHKGDPSKSASVLPMGRVKTMRDDERG